MSLVCNIIVYMSFFDLSSFFFKIHVLSRKIMLFVRRLMRKNRKVFVCGAVLLLLSVLLQLAARKADGFAGWYVRTVYSLLVGALGRIFGLFPFSVSEVGLYLLLISALAAVFRFRKKKIQLLAGSFCRVPQPQRTSITTSITMTALLRPFFFFIPSSQLFSMTAAPLTARSETGSADSHPGTDYPDGRH